MLEIFDDLRLRPALPDHGERVAGGAAIGIVINRYAHSIASGSSGGASGFVRKSQVIASMPTTAPQSSAMMKPGRSRGRMPENVFVKERAIATAGLANDVEAVNQYAAVMYRPTS